MAYRKKSKEEYLDPEVTQSPTIDMNEVEIRGRGQKWNVFYPDEQNTAIPVPVFKDGQVVGSVSAWLATNKLIEVHETFTSVEAAKEAAEFILPGCTIKVIKTSSRKEAAAKAAKTRKKRKEEE